MDSSLQQENVRLRQQVHFLKMQLQSIAQRIKKDATAAKQKVSLKTSGSKVETPVSLPRLDFAGQFVDQIVQGFKTATTRLQGEQDPNSDLIHLHVGTRCAATSNRQEFAQLVITRVQTMLVSQIDNQLARTENCKDAAELKALIKQFYPLAGDSAQIKVYYFSLRQNKLRVSSARKSKLDITQAIKDNAARLSPKRLNNDLRSDFNSPYKRSSFDQSFVQHPAKQPPNEFKSPQRIVSPKSRFESPLRTSSQKPRLVEKLIKQPMTPQLKRHASAARRRQ